MAINKIVHSIHGTLMDISQDTVTADTLLKGYTAHGANGELIEGNCKSSASKIVEVDVLPEIEFPFVKSDGGPWFYCNPEYCLRIEKDEEYIVTIDDVRYKCTPTIYDDDGSGYCLDMGAPWTDDGIDFSEFPFAIYIECYYPNSSFYFDISIQDSSESETVTHKVRIHREADSAEFIPIDTEIVIPTQNHNNGFIQHETPFRLIVGRTYIVSFADKTYEHQCSIDDEWGMAYIGNPGIAGNATKPGEDKYPFFMGSVLTDDNLNGLGVMIDSNTFPVGEDIRVHCKYNDIDGMKLEYRTITERGTYYPSSGYDGFAAVNVDPNLQDKNITSNGSYYPDDGYYGLSSVYVNVNDRVHSKTVTSNGTYYPNSGYRGLSSVTVNVPDTTPKLQTKNVTVNGTYSPDSGYQGFSSVTVAVPDPIQQAKTFTVNGTYTPDSGYYGFNSVTVDVPEPLPELQHKTVSANGVYSADEGYDGLGTITVFIEGDAGPDPRVAALIERNVAELSDDTATQVGRSAFYFCAELTSISLTNVTTVQTSAFSNCSKLHTVDMPKLKDVGDSAFYQCGALSNLSMQNIESTGYRSFLQCRSLTELNAPNLKNVGQESFYECTGLRTLNAPNIQTVAQKAFDGCSSLIEIELPSLTDITANYIFNRCYALETVSMPSLVSSVGNVFSNCRSLKNINMPVLTTISNSMFYGCSGLTSIDFDTMFPSVTRIYGNAFQACNGLTSIHVPDRITSLSGAFNGCTSLTSATIDVCKEGLYEVGSLFSGCKALQSVSIPHLAIPDPDASSSVEAERQFGSYLFGSCLALTDVNLPNLEIVGQYMFNNCQSLTYIDLPKVRKIYNWGFKGCTNLRTLIFRNGYCSLYNPINTFDNTPFASNGSGGVILTTRECVNSKQFEGWKFYENGNITILALEDYTVDGTITGAIDWVKLNNAMGW